MKLSALLTGVAGAKVVGPHGHEVAAEEVDVREVRDDSRLVAPGDLFVAVPGTATATRSESATRRPGRPPSSPCRASAA